MKKRGSLTVEAAIVVPIFLFVMFAFSSLIKVAYVHNVIQHALNDSANELSTYCYLYSISGAQKAHDDGKTFLDKGTKRATEHIDIVVDSYKKFNQENENLQAGIGGLAEGDLSKINDLTQSVSNLNDSRVKLTDMLNQIIKDPKGIVHGFKVEAVSFASLMANGAFEDLKGEVAELLMKALMSKHLSENGVDPNTRLLNLKVVKGLDGLDFEKTRIFYDKKSIDIIVSYEMKNIVQVDFLPTYRFTQRAVLKAWLDGAGNTPYKSPNPSATVTPTPNDVVWVQNEFPTWVSIHKQMNENDVRPKPGLSKFDIATGEGIKIRAIDPILGTSYLVKNKIYYSIKGNIDDLLNCGNTAEVNENGESKSYTIKSRKIIVVFPKESSTQLITDEFKRCKEYAQSKGIKFETLEFGVRDTAKATATK